MRATIIRMVLATDLSDHFKYLAELQDAFEIRVGSASGQSQAGRSDGGESAETSGVAGDGGGGGGPGLSLRAGDEKTTRIVLQVRGCGGGGMAPRLADVPQAKSL